MDKTMQFGYVMLLVKQMERSVEFYKKLLGREPEIVSPRWSQFTVGGALIALHNADSWSDPNDPLRSFGAGQKGSSFAIYVEDIDEFIRALHKDITIEYGPRMTGAGNLVYIRDPDGYVVQICQPVKK